MEKLLEIKNLIISESGSEPLVKNINFTVPIGKTVVLLGESGSGKSLTALSIIRLLPPNLNISGESEIKFLGQNLLALPLLKMRDIRGRDIAIIFQNPETSLNPVMSIVAQIEETIVIHQGLRGRALRKKALELLEIVQIEDPNRVGDQYPYQLSGGMKQRVMIAIALAGNPKLLIADEPTTALDVTLQADILKLLKKLQLEFGMSLLFITHDLTVASELADEVVVMKEGNVIESGVLKDILNDPKRTYTQELIKVSPKLKIQVVPNENATLLTVNNLKVYFPIKKGVFRRTVAYIRAVDDVSFSLKSGETLALVGESGSGKTTVGKSILSLIKPIGGEVLFDGLCLTRLKERDLRLKRCDFQMIVQDPSAAMDPRMRVVDIIEEGLIAEHREHRRLNKRERQEKIDTVLKQVGLKPEHKFRYPHQFSGGQKQRICIARALVVDPKLIICDEPTSSLDVTIQAQIIDLLIHLQQEYNLSYLFITHNISVVQSIAHRIAVMQHGQIVEYGTKESVLQTPKHLFTQKLLSSVPKVLIDDLM